MRYLTAHETVIQFYDDSPTARIYSNAPDFNRKIEAAGCVPTKFAKVWGKPDARWYEIPVAWVKVVPPKERKRRGPVL